MSDGPINPERVAFFTSAWQRDWSVVLNPGRFRMIVESQQHDFPIRLIILNNFRDAGAKAAMAADKLLKLGLATDVVSAPSYLSDSVLESFGFDAPQFWCSNPYYSTAHLAGLHFLQGKADWLFYINGDARLEKSCAWIPRALQALKSSPGVAGLNLCRNIYQTGFYPRHSHRETTDLWISNSPSADNIAAFDGFSLNDIAYLLPVAGPRGGWQFGASEQEIAAYSGMWPSYARPCFELYYRAAMAREGFGHAALKPKDGGPVTKHKNFPGSLKIHLYKALGLYGWNGKYGTEP